jgi:subtilisin family serine protease
MEIYLFFRAIWYSGSPGPVGNFGMLTPLIIASLLAAAPGEPRLLHDSFGNLRPCHPRMLVIGLRPATASNPYRPPAGPRDLGERRDLLAGSGAAIADACPSVGLLRVAIDEGEDLETVRDRLASIPEFRYVEPDWLGEGGFTPNDPFFPEEWHLTKIEAPAAWEITRGSDLVTVAMLDTGIDKDHPEFAGRVLFELGHNFVDETKDPTYDHPHGIYTTGILGANADNNFGGAGIDHRSKIIPVKILDASNKGTQWALIQGLTWAADRGARIINMSLINFPETDALKDALRYASEKGAILVACAGNGGIGDADVSWPGASPLCITVGATTSGDRRASFSGTGQALDLVAPGQDIQTVMARDGDIFPNAVTAFSGCSAATPVVAGIAALLLAVDPGLTADEVKGLLEHGAEDLVGGSDDKPGWDANYGWGRANALRSLQLLLGKRFLRGDSNHDGTLDISDAIFILVHFFVPGAGSELTCERAADANDDGTVDISDAISTLSYLFLSGTMPAPFPACGFGYAFDDLTCEAGCR